MRGDCHVLLVLFPAQGQINPCLQFAKRLVNFGVKVTLSTTLNVINRISNRPAIPGVEFAPFSDATFAGDFSNFYDSIKASGSEHVANLVKAKAADGAPFTRIIFTTFMAWVGEVARSLEVPATLLWIQPATVLDIYYHYFTDYQDLFQSCSENGVLEIPGLTALGPTDIPSYMLSKNPPIGDWSFQAMKDQIDLINSEENPEILVNTFDDLEFDALRAIKKLTLMGIGPLVPSAYLDGKDPSDTSFGGDLQEKSDDYVEWLDSQPKSSVIYVAFGSLSNPTTMLEEIAQGLVQTKMPFLWVIRETPTTTGVQNPEENLRCKEELEKQGKIVRWCNQVEVLQHPAIGCFVTHCGWNSTIESLVFGMPVVACPLWLDQCCNAKLVQDVWKTGKRVKANEDGIVEGGEVKRCIECVMGEEGGELRKNAEKWRELARNSMKEDGSSYLNLTAYVNQLLLN